MMMMMKPRVGVGVVVLRHLEERARPDVLLIRRGKPPSQGLWSFPGGSQELGESLIECAIREVEEETGARLQYCPDRLARMAGGTNKNDKKKEEEGEGGSKASSIPVAYLNDRYLTHPVPFAAVDVIDVDPETERIRYHYAVIEVAATVTAPYLRKTPAASDDADDVSWVSCDLSALAQRQDIVPNAIEVIERALDLFDVRGGPE